MYKKIIIAAILGMVLGALISTQFIIPKKKIIYKNTTNIRIDTVVRFITRNIIKYKVKADTIKYTDTINIITRPFVAIKDTIADKDTINIKYWFPEGVFAVDIGRFPIKQNTVVKYITVTKEKRIEDAWWVKPTYILGGVLVGFGLGRI